MNMNVRPHGTTTASHMSTNEQKVAEYPVVGYTRLTEGGPIVKIGWLFVSDDLKHDYYQVFGFSLFCCREVVVSIETDVENKYA